MERYRPQPACAAVRNSLDLAQLTTFLPEPPPLYAKSSHLCLLSAPFVALGGLSPNEKEIAKIPVPLKRRFFRKQAGLSNRWQLPFSFNCDLLGIAQAKKASRVGLNETLMRIMSADTPVSLNVERDLWKASMELQKESKQCSFPALSSKHKLKHRFSDQHRGPNDMLFSYTQKITEGLEPDVTLKCLGFEWELHRIYLFKSRVLARLLALAVTQGDRYGTENNSETEREIRCYKKRLLTGRKDKEIWKQKQNIPKVVIVFEIKDPDVTRYAFAIALKNLYSSEIEMGEEDVLGVLATAAVLEFPSLFQRCVQVMRGAICSANVCSYYSAGCKYKQPSLITDCERWIEVNLVPQLGSQIHLRKLPLDLLQKVLKSSSAAAAAPPPPALAHGHQDWECPHPLTAPASSPSSSSVSTIQVEPASRKRRKVAVATPTHQKLFTFNEFHLLRTALCWVFLQQNPHIQMIPSYDTVLTYFSSLPKICSFLEREIGQRYIAIFQSLRLQGITSSQHLEELWQINFLPLPWLTRILSDHYHALENGGDMAFQRDFNTQAVRFGLVLTQEPRYHSEIISIYGFFFEIKAVKHDASAYSFYMQRVKHADPIISFFTAECSPVSLKQEREVKYEIKAQCQIDGTWHEFSTERLTQRFGVKKPSCKSKVLKASISSVPIYVTFSLLFPPSMG